MAAVWCDQSIISGFGVDYVCGFFEASSNRFYFCAVTCNCHEYHASYGVGDDGHSTRAVEPLRGDRPGHGTAGSVRHVDVVEVCLLTCGGGVSDVIQAFLPVFLEKNRQECLYHIVTPTVVRRWSRSRDRRGAYRYVLPGCRLGRIKSAHPR